MTKKILIVDDSSDTRFALSDVLREAGYEPVEAASGEECLNLLRKSAFDVLIADIMMPGMDGWMLSHEVRKKSTIPIIIISGDKREITKRMAKNVYKAVTFVEKPFKAQQILTAVEDAIKQSEKN